MLPNSVKDVIERERIQHDEDGEIHLIRRKGDQEEQVEDIYTGIQTLRSARGIDAPKGSMYDLLPNSLSQTELLKFWSDFHIRFAYPNFATFYSKRKFCIWTSEQSTEILQSLPSGEDSFISLLADRKFLFLEDNEHGNNPEYPPMSEIVRNPKRYLESKQSPKGLSDDQAADAKMRRNAAIILKQGFMPTYAHRRAYAELKRNAEEIQTALRQRKEFIHRSSDFLKDGVPQFQPFNIPMLQADGEPTETEKLLSQLFYDFLYAAANKAYVKKYNELLDGAQKNSLAIIMCVNRYLNEYTDISACHALVFWQLFTKETVKLAKGTLKEFKFRMAATRSGLRLTKETQAPTYRKIDCQIMLFDYLLKILPPTDKGDGVEIAYAKFQFHAFSRYNGYTHFRVKNVKNFNRFDFDLIPDSKDSVDALGGMIRYHILRCISNDVRWLTPGLPNNWNINSSILATLLLQDSTRFPKSNRLVNRINALLNDKAKRDKLIETYSQLEGKQSKLIDFLNQFCNDNNLVFDEDIPSSDMEISDDRMKLLCSRLVLEYILKERSLLEVRQSLVSIAQVLWGSLLLTDYETFDLDSET